MNSNNTKEINERDIKNAANSKYPRYYSGYTNEQIEMDGDRRKRIQSFIEGAEWIQSQLSHSSTAPQGEEEQTLDYDEIYKEWYSTAMLDASFPEWFKAQGFKIVKEKI